VYHDLFSPPEVHGRCDKDGGALAQRIDDEPATVKRRLQVYNKLTRPLVEYYRSQQLLFEVDASCATEKVRGDVLARVMEILP
jgi:adenylate kinase